MECIWLKMHGICLLHVSQKLSLVQPLPTKLWNALLTAEFAAQKAQDHELAQGRRN